MSESGLPLPWHVPIIERMAGLIANDTLPNSIALTCADGWGHIELLSGVCSCLLELERENEDVAQLAHPDLRWIVPDGAVIKVDQIRAVNDFAVQTPQIAKRKVAAIVDAHLLNENAANALLKTLEEPPPNTHIVLATTRWGRLLPTIRSRCQRFEHEQSTKIAHEWLTKEGVSISEREFAELGYAPLAALTAANSLQISQWLDRIPQADLAELVDALSEIDLVTWLAQWYRAMLPMLVTQASPRPWFEFCDELVEIRRQIETSNSANSRLSLERLITLWRKLPSH